MKQPEKVKVFSEAQYKKLLQDLAILELKARVAALAAQVDQMERDYQPTAERTLQQYRRLDL